ncbi:fluoride efflux transporter CrcB [Fictibacillus sp. KIGAM418]|uniref:Fluoride-specific ion channel FluC n=1 Tax=Fictibacillus marinisediminis TaxID=2878389 RepID=A0A9X1X9D6_9BACL|nr:fluoride efflux transporter CrcB [Fictibacillus marinisediminis]MCK6256622.1 fluoride efflux transporter CrcB [Fictibacillus marinisediminis]
MMQVMLVAAGGFFGAIFRFGLGQFIKRITDSPFPIATLFVNITGSFLLGMLTGMHAGDSIRLFFGIGFMGAFTTFSTLKLENIQFYRKRQWKYLITYLAISYAGGLLAAFIGFMINFK